MLLLSFCAAQDDDDDDDGGGGDVGEDLLHCFLAEECFVECFELVMMMMTRESTNQAHAKLLERMHWPATSGLPAPGQCESLHALS